MATELTMPQMGYDMQEGTIVRWLKSEGAEVQLGEAIAEIETDKAVVEFESYAEGLLQKILVAEGSTVPVGQAIAIIGAEGELISEPSTADTTPLAPAPPPVVAAPMANAAPLDVDTAPSEQIFGVRASPVARRLADERGIDLSKLQGTGPGGRITKDDVLGFEAAPAVAEPTPTPVEAPTPPVVEPAAPPVQAPPTPTRAAPPSTEADTAERIPLSRMRQQIARVTVRSKQEKPHFYVASDIDMTQAMQLRQQINKAMEGEGVRITVNDLIVKACVDALKVYPKFNAFFDESGIQLNDKINIGIAMAQEEGLLVPAIMDCRNKSLRELAAASKDLADRAQTGALHSQEYTGGTFAISNLGMFDVSSFVAIIHPPQTAVLAIGTVSKKPVVRDDQVVVAQMMTATISADHRVVDGAEGARFIVEVKRLLENPLSLLV
ncbi:MAG: 2-oxo acid dehydrogenase subunit E2 [Chloroflexi bacterium]|nr:2-oxo acid dehydrogenase subunit E2 [Chloroflexota bacterium]